MDELWYMYFDTHINQEHLLIDVFISASRALERVGSKTYCHCSEHDLSRTYCIDLKLDDIRNDALNESYVSKFADLVYVWSVYNHALMYRISNYYCGNLEWKAVTFLESGLIQYKLSYKQLSSPTISWMLLREYLVRKVFTVIDIIPTV